MSRTPDDVLTRPMSVPFVSVPATFLNPVHELPGREAYWIGFSNPPAPPIDEVARIAVEPAKASWA